jgi:hypothetical protein
MTLSLGLRRIAATIVWCDQSLARLERFAGAISAWRGSRGSQSRAEPPRRPADRSVASRFCCARRQALDWRV